MGKPIIREIGLIPVFTDRFRAIIQIIEISSFEAAGFLKKGNKPDESFSATNS